jgi:amidase
MLANASMARTAADAAALLGAIAGPDPDDPTALQNPVPNYLADIDDGVSGLRIGIDRTLIAEGADADMVRATEEAAAVLAQIGALVKEVRFPSPDDVVRVAIPLCSVEAAVAHEATCPSRAGECGPALAGLLDTGRTLDGLSVTKMLLCREAFRGRLNALFRDIDLLIMPAMNVAAPTLADMTPARRTPAATEARIRFTAPFDMIGHPTLTLPGNKPAMDCQLAFRLSDDIWTKLWPSAPAMRSNGRPNSIGAVRPSVKIAQLRPGLWHGEAQRVRGVLVTIA